MGAKILIIDDDPASLSFMKYLLGSFGHAVAVVEDGVEGLNAARTDPPDLIISDAEIPSLNGCDLARQLKDDPALRKIPLIAVTASAMPADRQRMLAAGFDQYIAKPIVPETFVDEIEKVLAPKLRSESKPASAPAASPRVDRKALLVREMADAFVKNFPTLMENVHSAHSQGNFKSLRNMAHKTLGSCIFLQEPKLIEALRRLERAIDANQLPNIESLIDEVDKQGRLVSQNLAVAPGS